MPPATLRNAINSQLPQSRIANTTELRFFATEKFYIVIGSYRGALIRLEIRLEIIFAPGAKLIEVYLTWDIIRAALEPGPIDY